MAAIGRTPGLGIGPGWNAQWVDVMRWVLWMTREVDRPGIDVVLAAIGERAIVEVSTRDPWWGARPVADCYEGRNVLGRLWTELRHQLRESDPAGRRRRLDRADPHRLPRGRHRPARRRLPGRQKASLHASGEPGW